MKREVFSYGKMPWLGLGLSIAMIAMIVVGIVYALDSPRPDDVRLYFYFAPVISVFIATALFAYRDVVVYEIGMGRRFFGVDCAIVSWDDIVEVRCGVLSARDHSVGSYHLRTRVGSPFGGVRVMTMIGDVDRLVDIMNSQVLKRHVPIKAWDVNTLVTVDQLPPPKKGAAAWT